MKHCWFGNVHKAFFPEQNLAWRNDIKWRNTNSNTLWLHHSWILHMCVCIHVLMMRCICLFEGCGRKEGWSMKYVRIHVHVCVCVCVCVSPIFYALCTSIWLCEHAIFLWKVFYAPYTFSFIHWFIVCILQNATVGSLATTALIAVVIARMVIAVIMKRGSVITAVRLDTMATGVILVSWLLNMVTIWHLPLQFLCCHHK